MWFSGLVLYLVIAVTLAGPYSIPTCAGRRKVIVHLFEWKWTDIAAECERFLGPYGYCGVQISPPNENRIVTKPNRPWWERYQPVSYKLQTRSGTEAELRDMVDRCNKVNVRIYVDAVINHMTGSDGSGVGTAGSSWNANKLSFPGVPYSASDFNSQNDCETFDMNIHNVNDSSELRNCRLYGLADLKLRRDYVKEKVTAFMNKLIDMGVGGFRIDAALHMWPGELTTVMNNLHNLNTTYFQQSTRPFIFQEVSIKDDNSPIRLSDYLHSGRVTDFTYGLQLSNVMRKHKQAKFLKTWGEPWGMPDSNDAIVFIDNHDTQRSYANGAGVLTHFEPKLYKLAVAFMLAHPYGFIRLISSYDWKRNFVGGHDTNNWIGPPHNADMSVKNVVINSDLSCGNNWTCEHRWRQMYNMVAFRNVVGSTDVQHWWDNGDYQIAFGRGNKGFFVMNLQGSLLDVSLQTGLPRGTYCDVISGNFVNNICTGGTIMVGADGNAHFVIDNNKEDQMIAIHVGAKIGSKKIIA